MWTAHKELLLVAVEQRAVFEMSNWVWFGGPLLSPPPPQPTLSSHYSASVHTSAFHPIRSLYSLCLTHHLFHAPLSLANDAWRCNVANLTALPVLKSYSPLIKAAVHPFMAFSLSANRSGSATALLRIINGNKPSETGKKVRGEEEEEEEEFCS